MDGQTALLTFSIGPVHTFIEQARRLADQWAGSRILSHLTGEAMKECFDKGGKIIFPAVASKSDVPTSLPNRFVCRVPLESAEQIAKTMEVAVGNAWGKCIEGAVEILECVNLEPARELWDITKSMGERSSAESAIETAWSYVPEERSYPAASRAGAETFAASRMYRPFSQIAELNEKCAVCGERTALPDGNRKNVREAWKNAAEETEKTEKSDLEPYFRKDQGRLCLVCATKRLFPKHQNFEPVVFKPFKAFEPSDEKPYIAVVKMDGDKMGEVLGWDSVQLGTVEEFHGEVSKILTEFSESLHHDHVLSQLNLKSLKDYKPEGESPALIYAGGEDVLFVCDPRDALPLARLIQEKYREAFKPMARSVGDECYNKLTISAAILFTHGKQPASLMFRDVEDLLAKRAKEKEGRDAVALRLAKRGGIPVEIAFKWDSDSGDGTTWVSRFEQLVKKIIEGQIASRQSFNLAEEEKILAAVFETEGEWTGWLTERLSRGEGSRERSIDLAKLLSPFFMQNKTGALRIARFLGREVSDGQ